MRRREALHEGWTLRAADGPVPAALTEALAGQTAATVPGCVHTDLLAAGLIPDPYRGENEGALVWIGRTDWIYTTTFTRSADGADRHDLVFDGVDTVAEIRLNDVLLAEVANQHRTHRLPVDGALRDGANTLEVRFAAPLREADARSVAMGGGRPRPYPHPYEALRKSAANFGWDWGIATFTSGLWRPVSFESWSVARLAEVRVSASPEGSGGTVHVEVAAERSAEAADTTVVVSVSGPTGAPLASSEVPVVHGRAAVDVALDAVDRWWPRGHGDQPLYAVSVSLRRGDDVLDEQTRRVGFRIARWETAPDAEGAPFTLVVNDRPVWVKGVNWIPDDAFFARVDRERYARRLGQAADAHVNLVRVWGGGIYESDDFYDLCDKLGLLTWQDFLFACAAYPEDDALVAEVEAEVRQNVGRLAHHASLVLLNGNNENLWGYEDWGWQPRLDGRTWGAHYYYDLLPRLVAEIAPQVPYTPGSPFSPGMGWDGIRQTGPHPNDEHHGSTHLWEQWNRQDWTTYRDHAPRFVAEFGWQGPPTWTTLTTWFGDDPLTPESPGMIAHQKADEGIKKLEAGLVPHLRVPTDMRAWHWAMQLNQAVAVRTAIEHFRSRAPHTMGAIVWQLNDCWPAVSWAAVDGEGRAKPLLHALRAAFAPRTVTVQPRDGGLAAVLVNDTPEVWRGELRMSRLDATGLELAAHTTPVDVPAWGASTVALPHEVATTDAAAEEFAVAAVGGIRGTWFFAEPRDSAFPPAEFSLEAVAAADGVDVTITAGTVVRDLTLLVDEVSPDAEAHDGLVTMLPGERHTIHVTGLDLDAAERLLTTGAVRTTDELVTARERVPS